MFPVKNDTVRASPPTTRELSARYDRNACKNPSDTDRHRSPSSSVRDQLKDVLKTNSNIYPDVDDSTPITTGDRPQELVARSSAACRSLAILMVSVVELLEAIREPVRSSPGMMNDSLAAAFDKFDADVVRIALVHARANTDKAAKLLDLDSCKLEEKMTIYGIDKKSLALALACMLIDAPELTGLTAWDQDDQ